VFLTVFILLLLVGVPAAVFAGLKWRVSAAVDRGAAIAQALGLRQGPPHKSMHWYLGDERGRALGIVQVALRTTGTGTRPSASMGVRIAMRVESRSDVVVYRPVETPNGLETFDHAFGSTRGDALSPAAREALLGFARTCPGEVRLRPRKGAHHELVPAAVLPDAPAILTHDFIGGAGDPAQVRLRIQAMRAVVAAIEGQAFTANGEHQG
jgi:hypothetical protein